MQPGRDRPFSRSLPTGRDRLQVHYRGTPRKNTHPTCGADRRSPKSRGAPRRRAFQPGRKNKSRSAAAPRPTRSLQKTQGALQRCSAAGHFERAYVTGCKSTIGEHHGKIKAARHVSFRPALPKSTGAPRRQPFHFEQTSNKEAPDTPLRYVTGFNII